MTADTDTRADAGELRNPFFARVYHHVIARDRSAKDLACRTELLSGLTGTVVEVGPGNGQNFDLYPRAVERVVAVEPEPYLRERAARKARDAPVPIEVVPGTAERLPLADGSADAIVLALVLCSVPDQAAALREARRVLREGGELRVYEHVVAERALPRALQKAAEVTFWRRAFGNCHPTRDTRRALADAGFDVAAVRRFVMRSSPVEPPLPFILGRARPRVP